MEKPREVVNAKGPATVLGAAQAPARVVAAMDDVLRRSVHMGELQAAAGGEIARMVGAEAAFVTGCAAAGMVVGVAAAIAGGDLADVTMLPRLRHDRNQVVLQKAHSIIVGGCSADQVVRIPGGRPVEAGTAADCADFHVRAELNGNTAAGLYVVGERASGSGTLGLSRFAELCHEHGVPVIVDAAGTLDPGQHLHEGADLVVFSAHKWLRGPTAGVVAGRRDLVHAAFLHGEFGVGRPMKAGKEGVAGTLEALRMWQEGAHRERAAVEERIVGELRDRLGGLPGARTMVVDTGHESTAARTLRVDVDPAAAGVGAWELAQRLEAQDPSIALYDYEAAQGYLLVDPGFLEPDDAERIARAFRSVLVPRPDGTSASAPPPRFALLAATMEGWNRR